MMKINQKRSQQHKLRPLLIYATWALSIASIVALIVFAYLNLGILQKVFAGSSYTSAATGAWSTNSTWVGNTAPPTTNINGDNITVKSNHTVTSGALDVKNGTTFTVQSTGTLYIAGDLTVDNNLTLNISGTLIITGSLITKNGAKLTVNGGGTVKVSGNASFDQNAVVTVNGSFTVNGTITFGSNPTFNGSGLVSTSNTGCSAWTGTGTCTFGTMPVKLLSLAAHYNNSSVIIKWKTASEENNNYFTLERTEDGINYKPIATVPGAGTTLKITNYVYEDLNPFVGRSYYRLTQTDYDGKRETFPQVTIDVISSASFTIYPNPLVGNHLNISIAKPEEGVIEVVDNKGNRVYVREVNNETNFQLIFNENLDPGIYFVKYKTSTVTKTERLVKD